VYWIVADGLQIAEIGVILMECASPMTAGDERSVLDWANHLSTAPEASRLAVRLHLLTLLFAVCKIVCNVLSSNVLLPDKILFML